MTEVKKFDRVFVANPSFKYDASQLYLIADQIVYSCDMPMFDNLMTPEFVNKFEHKIAERLSDFNPDKDIVAYYGDSLIFALMVMWLSDNFDSFQVARYSSRDECYMIREMSYDNFVA